MSANIYQQINEITQAIKRHSSIRPQVGIILGSGLGSLAAEATDAVEIPYTNIPHFHGTSVEGHAGKMILGTFHGVPTVFLQGRFHLYEGYSMDEVVLPTRVICALGIHTVVLTNAAGGINTRYRPGDLMLINDHLNLMGDNPLKGPNLAKLGPRFPDLSEAYSKTCLDVLSSCAEELSMPVHSGVYGGLLGPTYETPAEVRMLRTLGADAVGMSTVPESIAANHLGVRVAGVSCITNLAAGLSPRKLSHQEVIENSRLGVEKLHSLMTLAIPRLVKTKSVADVPNRAHALTENNP
ncbi:MAG: purine-nucleoside phosphorylase [Oligoflexia bacterium]|nr:purine-nucleoside phosphorylase [Oligoflexia bacterium]